MSDYDPNNPQHPLDRLYEHNKHWLKWLLLPAMPAAFAMIMYGFMATFEKMPHTLWLGGIFSVGIVCLAILHLIDHYNRSADD